MGFLSRAAETTFKKTRRRAYVPDWFRPFSYVAGAAALLGLVVVGAFGNNSLETPVPTEASAQELATEQSAIAKPSGAASEDAGPSVPAPAVGDGSVVVLKTPAGEPIEVPSAAVAAAQEAAQALFTGDFTSVKIAPGQVAPTISSPWPNASAAPPVTAVSPPSSASTLSIEVPVDPDGATGSEARRSVSVTVRQMDGLWVYLPYASG